MRLLDSAADLDPALPEGAAAALRSTSAVRERAHQLLERARAGKSHWFTVIDDEIGRAANEVADLTRTRYPDLEVPYHSRWRHFEAGGVDRKAELDALLADLDAADRGRAMIDLTVVSVLLDAGAGPDWRYRESSSGQLLTRSEGLGVASWHAFLNGAFSSDPANPLQADATALRALTTGTLAEAFQVGESNPLVGLEGRVQVLHRLGDVMAAAPEVFGSQGRPGGMFDILTVEDSEVTASRILALLLDSLSAIWPANNTIGALPLGDCWRHAAVSGPGMTKGWVPFHKLSQWLTYSLLEPLEWAGVHPTGLDALTGLPEYRNGGLLLDTGVLRLRDPAHAARPWAVDDELVVEWRAVTVGLLDELAPLVRARLGVDAQRFPLACVLEGGTWAAGRALAQRMRGGTPPITVTSDGTVF